LGKSQVTPFSDHLAAQLITIDSYALIGLVSNIFMGFRFSFDISPDAAIPEQIRLRFQQMINQLVWRQAVSFYAKQALYFVG